jgi:hypothetical protein
LGSILGQLDSHEFKSMTIGRGDSINNINCFHCVHFSITWDAKFPKACKVFGFKTAGMPSATVFRATGSDCAAFAIKRGMEGRKKQAKG